MSRKHATRRTPARAGVHVTLDAELAARLRAFAGFHGRDLGDVVAEGVKHVMRGFSARQEAHSRPEPGQGRGPQLAVGTDDGDVDELAA